MLGRRGVWVNAGQVGAVERHGPFYPDTQQGRPRISFDTGPTARSSLRSPSPEHPLGVVSSGTLRGVEDGISMRLQGNKDAAAHARKALSKLRGDLDPPLMETLRLLVTELVTNSVKHAGAKSIVLKVLVGRSAVWTEVTDEGPGFERADTGRPSDDRSGWGLFLVERLAHRWGVKQEGGSTKVWFELRRS
jgi:anti-sigma regulatory factor (Ser/Thr protein kinase)